MAAKLVVFFGIVAAAAAVAVPVVPHTKLVYAAEPEAPAHYEFEYSVHDTHTGDIKQQKESRSGHAVQGVYSLVQPDGVHRIVEYTADEHHGFNANVRYEGHPVEAPAKIAYAAAPSKIAYAAPVAYAHAPVAKVAYAPAQATYAHAPVTRVSYAPAPVAYAQAPAHVAYAHAPVAKVAYAQPIQKIAYAPAQVSYASAPVTKVAYSAPLGHVTFSSPAVSYHH